MNQISYIKSTFGSEDDNRRNSWISTAVMGPKLNHVIGVWVHITKLITDITWVWNFGSANESQYFLSWKMETYLALIFT